MSRIARRCRLGRESFYKSLSDKGNPEFRTILAVLKALGMRLRVESDPAFCQSPGGKARLVRAVRGSLVDVYPY